MKALMVALIVLAFLGVLNEIAEEMRKIRKELEKIMRSVSIYEVSEKSDRE